MSICLRIRILEINKGIRIGAIFSGGDQGNLSYVRSHAARLSLEGKDQFIGFVGNNT